MKAIEYRHILLSKFLSSLGVLMLVLEILRLVPCVDSCIENSTLFRIIILIIIVAVSLLIAFCSVFGSRKDLKLEINKRTNLIIERNDLMQCKGLRVIPVNEYFDTHLGDNIINEKTLHGKFLSLFGDNIDELKKQIDIQLSKKTPLPKNRERTLVPDLPQKRYPLGTYVRVSHGDDNYLLVALTRFNADEHNEVSSEEYPEIIRKLFNGIETFQNGGPVFMPLIGSGISGFQLTNMQMLNTIVQAAYNADVLSVTNGIYICLYDDNQMRSLNLNLIKYLFDRWKALK